MWYGNAPVISSHPTIGTTTQARAAPGVHIGQPATKTALKASRKVRNRPAVFLGSGGPGRRERVSVANRHEPPCHAAILRFWPAISEEPGCTSRKKVPSGVWFKPMRRSQNSRSPPCTPPHQGENLKLDRGRGGMECGGLFYENNPPQSEAFLFW